MATNKIDDQLDPARPGVFKWGVVLTPGQIMEASRRGIKSATGKTFQLIEPAIDPTSKRVLALTAPPDLQQRVKDAEAQYHNAVAVGQQLSERSRVANRDLAEFSRGMLGYEMTDVGRAKWKKLTATITECEQDCQEAEKVEQEARVKYLHAERQLQNWIDDERLKLTGAAPTAEVEDEPPLPLSERLAKLKEKLIG